MDVHGPPGRESHPSAHAGGHGLHAGRGETPRRPGFGVSILEQHLRCRRWFNSSLTDKRELLEACCQVMGADRPAHVPPDALD